MAQVNMQTVRNPPPRMLSSTETLYSLGHWITSFRTYYRRDGYYKGFLLPDARWNATQVNYGQVQDINDQGVVTRSAQDKSEDLKDFLSIIVGFLPFPYLTEKIVNGTKKLQDVWDALHEHYGLLVTGESLLDFAAMAITNEESYRQFFDRLLAHARLHLVKENVTVDGITSGENGETLSISLMNFVAMEWLRKINSQLINIVKLEYSKDLRDGEPLVALVPRISTNIDAMLQRHNVASGVEKVSINGSPVVSKVNFRNYQSKQGGKKPQKSKPFCPECHYLGKKLNLKIDVNHVPKDCPRPKTSVNLLLADVNDGNDDNDDAVVHSDYDFTGKNNSFEFTTNTNIQMKSDEVEVTNGYSNSGWFYY